jgi:hypothetical protein
MVRRETGEDNIISARPALEYQLETDSGDIRRVHVPEEAGSLARAVACIMLRAEVALEDKLGRLGTRRH